MHFATIHSLVDAPSETNNLEYPEAMNLISEIVDQNDDDFSDRECE